MIDVQGELPEVGANPLGAGEEEDVTAQLPDVPTAEPTGRTLFWPVWCMLN